LRWDFVFQRPQHLMSRFAKSMPVVIWEEPLPAQAGEGPSLDVRPAKDMANVTVVTPRLPEGLEVSAERTILKGLLDQFVSSTRDV
jgi:UDP-galactopyranose mutase